MTSIAEALAIGTRHHQAGRLAEAEQAYRQVLAAEPEHPQALHQLGMLAMQTGDFNAAAALLERAIAGDGAQGVVHAHVGEVYRQLGQMAQAEVCYRQALNLQPELTAVRVVLGVVLAAQGRPGEAAESLRAALASSPDDAEAHRFLATILKDQGLFTQAASHFERVIQLQPQSAAAHAELAACQAAQGQLDAAIASSRAALRLDSTLASVRHGLGWLLQKQGRLHEALACFDEVIRDHGGFPQAHLSRASVHRRLGDLQRAIADYRAAIRLNPDIAEAHNALAVALSEQGKDDAALESYRRAIELSPNDAQTHLNLAVSLQRLCQLDAALVHYRRAVELAPDNAEFHANLLFMLNYIPGYDPALVFAEHRTWGQRHADPLLSANAGHANDRTPERRLRIGYVSPNFGAQAVTFFSEPILAAHDHRQFEIFCYADVRRPDAITRRLQGYVDHWRDTLGLSDEQLSELVRRDQIDILVDLTGHMGADRRLLAFARKPAPVQVTYIGYQNTTGMLAMDYRLTDNYADPPGMTEALHTEELARLPQTFFCYRPADVAPPVGPLPARSNGFVTFGSVNNFLKVNPEVLQTWAELLNRVPGSRLMLRADMSPWLRNHLQQTFALHGISAERLELVDALPLGEYLKLIDRIDIALDPFPFIGHTTTCDCLWQGVPVVTLVGSTYVSRFGASGLATLELQELIATTREQYLQIAADLAGDLNRLERLRADLRPRMARSALLDFQGFTRNLEAEYRRMWRAWCAMHVSSVREERRK